MRGDEAGAHTVRGSVFFPWLSAYLVLLSVVQVAVLGSSLASVPLSRPLAIVILIGSLLAAHRVRRDLTADAALAAPWAGLSGDRWTRALAGGFLALFLFLLACAVCVTDLSWDGNTYHLPVIQQWFQRGHVAWIEGPDSADLRFMNGYPKAAEVISFFLCTLVHPALSNTLNLAYLPLGILGIACLAQSFGASFEAALAAGAAFLLVPINMGQSLTTYVDSASGSAAIAWLAVLAGSRRIDATRLWLPALVFGCAVGLLIGTKGTGLLLGAIGVAALGCIQLSRRPTAPAKTLGAWWLVVIVCALAVGGFWYVRNIAHGKSPLFPMGLSVGGVSLLPGDDPYALAGAFAANGQIEHWPALVRLGFTWLQGLWHWPRSIVGFDMRLGGLGFLWPLGCVPAVWALARRRFRVRAAWRDELMNEPLWLVLAIVSLGIVVLPYTWWSRFTIWVYGLGLPCMAAMAGVWTGRRGRAWLVACAAIACIEAGVVIARWQVPLLGIAIRDEHGGPARPAPAVRVPSHFFPPWVLRGTVVERIARGSDTVAIGPLEWYQEPIIGVLSGPVGARSVHFVPDAIETEFAAWYAKTRPRYVVMNQRPDVPAAMAVLHPQVHPVRSLMVLQFW